LQKHRAQAINDKMKKNSDEKYRLIVADVVISNFLNVTAVT